MIKEVKMYSVVCDRCGKTFIDEFNGIMAWLDEGTAKEQAMESEWAEIGDKHYCPDFYKRKALNKIKLLLISAKNRFCNAIDGVMIPPDERYREKSKAFEELEKALKELED